MLLSESREEISTAVVCSNQQMQILAARSALRESDDYDDDGRRCGPTGAKTTIDGPAVNTAETSTKPQVESVVNCPKI